VTAPSQGFPPATGPGPRVLVLGTLPGAASLRRQEYYGLPRNRFWWIMGQLTGAVPELPYAERLAKLAASGVALWDVCHSAHRPGSLDAAIARASIRPNDIAAFVAAHPTLCLVACNGATAATLYRRFVTLPLPVVRLPSTSPAHARMPAEAKLALWREALAPLLSGSQHATIGVSVRDSRR
jgi:hypoxanthine-DNA glycosylase